jgi:hypothetical protein
MLIALSLPALAQGQTPPAAPLVTVGTPVLKMLRFDWQPVPGATHYVLQIKPNASSSYQAYGNPILAPRALAGLTIPVHALDWVNARYKVSACNAAGCTDSSELNVQDLMLTSIGYFKASNPDADDRFGITVALSQDGSTLVTSAWEDSNATGVNGDQTDNSATDTGAVYVFRRIGVGWRQEAYLKSDGFGLYFGQAISVSSDGSVVAVGSPGEQDRRTPLAGSVYLFTRAANGTWSQTQKVPPRAPQLFYYFGTSVDLSDDASVLAVTSLNPDDPEGPTDVTTHIFRRSDTGWEFELTLPKDECQDSMSQMAGIGTLIVDLCSSDSGSLLRSHRHIGANWIRMQDVPLSSGTFRTAVSGNSARAAVSIRDFAGGADRVQVFARVGNQWVVEQYIDPPRGATFLAFNRNGTMLAIGDPTSSSGGAGVSDTAQPETSPPPSNQDGAVYVYQRGESGWTLLKVVKAPNPANGDFFGNAVALSGNGLTLAVGASREDSAARGIDGNQADNSKEAAGAVYLY